MKYKNLDFNNQNILITGGAGFIGSNLAFYFQEKFPDSNIVIFDCFRSEAVFSNGNPKYFLYNSKFNLILSSIEVFFSDILILDKESIKTPSKSNIINFFLIIIK